MSNQIFVVIELLKVCVFVVFGIEILKELKNINDKR